MKNLMKCRIKRLLKKFIVRLRGWSNIEDLQARGMKVGDGCRFEDGYSFDYSFPHLISIENDTMIDVGSLVNRGISPREVWGGPC